MITPRLEKFVERAASREGTGRTAYVLHPSSLPEAADGFEWKKINAFNAAEEIINKPGVTEIFKAAIRDGYAPVEDAEK
jgi:hypothetical protein